MVKKGMILEKMSQQIEREVDEKLQGDAVYTNGHLADQRVLNMSNPNYFFVRKQDFNSPNTFNLNIMKPYPRSRIRAFVSKEVCKNEEERKVIVNQLKDKFLSRDPLSSQITNKKQKVVNRNEIYESNKTD